MKGLILAGGKGTRLLPASKIINKHMIPILNRPMIMYPLETLKSLGITEIMIVTGGGHVGGFTEFLDDGSEFGVNLTYRVQKEAGGIAQALGLAESFANKEGVTVILGDNIFDNSQLSSSLFIEDGFATIFVKRVPDPERFGVVNFDLRGNVTGIEEKPAKPKSNFAVTGLYKYPADVFEVVKTLQPSARGEIEITSVNNFYINERRCTPFKFSGFWSDAGTPKSLFDVTKWAYGKN